MVSPSHPAGIPTNRLTQGTKGEAHRRDLKQGSLGLTPGLLRYIGAM